nr:hypothetical protein [Tanacetum cinerariifolium]
YPRFIQVFLDKQLEGLSNHERNYVAHSHTKKIFRNMRRIGKGFSERITPLFPTMVVQSQMGGESATDEAVHKKMDGSLGLRSHRDTIAQTRSEKVSRLSNDLLLARGNTLQSDEDSMKLNELMELCTTLQSRVLDLEETKTTQALEIDSLKTSVKRLKKKQRSRTQKLKRLYKVGLTTRVESSDDEQSLGKDASKQGRINDIHTDEGITLVSTHDDADKDLHDEEVFVSKQDENVVEKEVDAAQV